MQSIFQIFESLMDTSITTKTIKLDWTKNFKDVWQWALDHKDDWDDEAKDALKSSAEKFYHDNPRKQKVNQYIHIEFSYAFPTVDPKLQILNDLYQAYNRAGMSHWWFRRSREPFGRLDKRQQNDLYRKDILISLSNKSQLGNIQYKDWGMESWRGKSDKESGSESNLSGEYITEYREKLLSCIDSTILEITKTPENKLVRRGFDKDTESTLVGSISVVLTPKFNKSKLEKLYKELQNDEKWMHAVEYLAAYHAGVSKYYKEKRSGGYTGD